MKIIADKFIPEIETLFGTHANITRLHPDDINAKNIKYADGLIVRTVTQVNTALLENSFLKFVASASAGKDHIDEEYLKSQNIRFFNAPGCNALAVTNYVLSVMACLSENIINKKIGVIGVGHVGSLLSNTLRQLGARVIENDPPRGLQNDVSDCDIVTVHTPLTQSGTYPTYHLLNAAFLKKLKSDTIIINTARGGVLDESALRDDLIYCLDVWENEPNVSVETHRKAKIATPHIAGYTEAAKCRAVEMIYQQFCKQFNQMPSASLKPKIEKAQTTLKLTIGWEKKLLNLYDPRNDCFRPEDFKKARRSYALRREIVFL